MANLLRLIAATLLCIFFVPPAGALEIGELTVRSRLGEPFRGEIRIQGELHSQIGANCVQVVPPLEAGGLPQLQNVAIEYATNHQGGLLRLFSNAKVLEPALSVSVRIGCGINMRRDYTLLMDLPGTASSPPEPPRVAVAPPRPNAVPARSTGARPRTLATRPMPSRTDRHSPNPAAEPMAGITASGIASGAAVPSPAADERASPAAPVGEPVPEETAPRAPLAQVPPNIDRQAAPSSSHDNLIAGGLILVITLLLLGIWYQHRRDVQQALAQIDASLSPERRVTPPAQSASAAGITAISAPKPVASAGHDDDEMPVIPGPLQNAQTLDLTDIVLGFDETQRALSALQDVISGRPDDIAASWLGLLELLRQHDKREEFEALAAKLHQVFNVAITPWEQTGADLYFLDEDSHSSPDGSQQHTSLEDFTHIRPRLVKTWGSQKGLDYLNILLLDNRAGLRQGFPIQVVEEIILLMEILSSQLAARD